jgi:ABC-type amino acid transport substrate-binding protein
MKLFTTLRVALVALVCSAALAEQRCPSTRTPHSYSSDSKTFTCYDVWQKRVFDLTGCPIDFTYKENMSGARQMLQLKHGEIDFLVGLSHTEEREQFLDFSEPFGETRVYFYTLRSTPEWAQISTWCDAVMKQARVLLPDGRYFGPNIEQLKTQHDCAKEVALFKYSGIATIGILERGRADIFALTEEGFNRFSPSQQNQLIPSKLVVWRDQLRFGLRKGHYNRAFINKLNTVIQTEISKNGPPCELSLPSKEKGE